MNALYLLRHVLAAAEPLSTGERHFDFYFWRRAPRRALSVAEIDDTLDAVTRVIAPSHATISGPIPIKRFAAVKDACRVKVRVTTPNARNTIALLVNKLPLWSDFVAFCNDVDADDSFIEPTDKAGIRAMAVELLEEYD